MKKDEDIPIERVKVVSPTADEWRLILAGVAPVREITREEMEKLFPPPPPHA